MNRDQQIEKEKEARKHPDIELLGFVGRGPLIVLQTHGDNFEKMNKNQKLASIGFMIKSLRALEYMVEKD